MIGELRTLDDLDVEGRRVLLRADLDVPLTPASDAGPARVADDARIRAALTTVDELRRRGARLVLVAHLDRPAGFDRALSMAAVADRLEELTGAPVPLAPAVVGSPVCELTERLEPGQMLMLENVRFERGETRDDPALAAALAEHAELYVNDAFVNADESHASTCGVARHLPCAAGRLFEREVSALAAILDRPARPLVAVLGGARAVEKIGLVRSFLEIADAVCVGGAICFPFLAAQGHRAGYSLCQRDAVEAARRALAGTDGLTARLELPVDLTLARWGTGRDSETRALAGVDVPDGWVALDVGGATAHRFAAHMATAASVFWSGPLGRVEIPQFAAGTRAIADAVAFSPATTVIAGDETAHALARFGLRERVSHVSSGGGATRGFLERRRLPGLDVLLQSAHNDGRQDRRLAADVSRQPASVGNRPVQHWERAGARQEP
jgi:phosphoglycerate kinase